jgi:hypothetical protein
MEFKHRVHTSPTLLIRNEHANEEKQATLLNLLYQLEKKGKITSNEKKPLKFMILRNYLPIYTTLESFQKHGDEDEFLDTLNTCLSLQNEKEPILFVEPKELIPSYGIIVWIVSYISKKFGISYPIWAIRYGENIKQMISFLEESFGDVVLFHIWESCLVVILAAIIHKYQFAKKYLYWLGPV